MISHLALSPHPTSWLSDVMHLLTAAFPQVPRAAARWRARRHDVTTLPALADYHERPRRTLTTRRAGDRTGMLAESHSPVKPWGDGYSWQVGGATTRRDTWAWGGPYGPSWRIALGLTPRQPTHHPPCGSSTRSSRQDKNETVTREGIGITFL